MNAWVPHEPHPVTGTCVWCHANSTSSVGCTRGQSEVEKLKAQALRDQAELAQLRTLKEAIDGLSTLGIRFSFMHRGTHWKENYFNGLSLVLLAGKLGLLKAEAKETL